MEKYRKVAEFVKQLRVADSELIPTKGRSTYETLTQEACSEYFNLFGSNYWEPEANTKEANELEFSKVYAD